MPRISDKSNAEQLWSALVEPAVKSWLSDRGFVMGDFHGQRNMLDVLRDDAFQKELDTAIRGSAQADRPTYEKLLKGMASLGGVKWTSHHDQLAKSVSGDIAKIAPYVQRWAPDVFDQLHGSKGSVASLTHAIAEANRNTFSPVDAHAHATQIFDQLYNQGDHMTTRGFSAREMGEMYRHLARRGAIGAGTDAKTIARRLQEHAAPISAIRDSLNFQRQSPASMDEIFNAFDALPAEHKGLPAQDLETQIRSGDLLNRQGGLFSAAVKSTGGLPPGLDLQQLQQKDELLRQRAAASPYGNLEGAHERIRQMGMDPATVDPSMLRDMRSQYEANTQATRMSPELTGKVRDMQQGEVERRVTSLTRSLTNRTPQMESAARQQAAMRMGYQGGAAEMDALHGAPMQAATHNVMQHAQQQASNAQAVSGMGQMHPLQRISQGLQDATPSTTATDLFNTGMNIVPKAEIPKLPGMPKLGAHPALPILQQIKEHSDRKQFGAKHVKLRALMLKHPEEWEIDEADKHHPGVTHKPTGFRLHTSRVSIPSTVLAKV